MLLAGDGEIEAQLLVMLAGSGLVVATFLIPFLLFHSLLNG